MNKEKNMIYIAPMEGITGYVYRNAYNKVFHNIDKYYTPFIMPNQNKSFNSKELNDILPEHNQGINIVPQILTNKSEQFLNTANKIKQLGYDEVNFNLGCPSKTVVTKKKGAGFLTDPEELDKFLDEVFSKTNIDISIKTRLGIDDPEEFYELLEIYNKYPLKNLIIHPRVQSDYYKNVPNMQIFADAVKLSKNNICYNGNIFKKSDYDRFRTDFPMIKSVMIGRGIIGNPLLVSEIKNERNFEQKSNNIELLRQFHDNILEGYCKSLSGDKNVLFKMKEIWSYMIKNFPDSDKTAKKIKKASSISEYEVYVNLLFASIE